MCGGRLDNYLSIRPSIHLIFLGPGSKGALERLESVLLPSTGGVISDALARVKAALRAVLSWQFDDSEQVTASVPQLPVVALAPIHGPVVRSSLVELLRQYRCRQTDRRMDRHGTHPRPRRALLAGGAACSSSGADRRTDRQTDIQTGCGCARDRINRRMRTSCCGSTGAQVG
jgi:hypothetical protein